MVRVRNMGEKESVRVCGRDIFGGRGRGKEGEREKQ